MKDMKRFTYAMIMAVALIVMVSSFAFAGDEECAKKAEAKTAKAECTTAEKAACASSTATATATAASAECKSTCADKAAYKAASADMHECCATAVAAGNGCCGHSADEMKADFDKKVAEESKKVASS